MHWNVAPNALTGFATIGPPEELVLDMQKGRIFPGIINVLLPTQKFHRVTVHCTLVTTIMIALLFNM